MSAPDWTTLWLEEVDSTNEECKRQAHAGAAGGLAVVARAQTRGKGRRGRSFLSLPNKGLYLSLLLYPSVPPEQLSQLTAWTAVAASKAIQKVSGISPDIKWPNDLLVGGKKLCGILTESGTGPQGLYVVIGIGVNLAQTDQDFGPGLSPIAVSLSQLGRSVTPEEMADALLEELHAMYLDFPQASQDYLAFFRRKCVTLGKEVLLISPSGTQTAYAVDVDKGFSLLVRFEDGSEKSVTAGEVSVRGLLGCL